MVASVFPPGGYDMSDEPPEVLHAFLITTNVVSAASWAVGALCGRVDFGWVKNGWAITLLMARTALAEHPLTITPLAADASPAYRVTVNGTTPKDELLTLMVPRPALAMFAVYAALAVAGDPRVVDFPMPSGLTIEGSAAEWTAIAEAS